MAGKIRINTKTMSNFIDVVSKQGNRICSYVVKNKKAFIVGSIGGGLAVDDIRLRIKNSKQKTDSIDRMQKTKSALLKHETKICTLEKTASKVPELIETNNKLRQALVRQQED